MWDAGGARTLRPRGAADRGATQAEAVAAAEARMILEIFIATGGAAALVADPVRWTAESHSRWVKFEAILK